MKIYSVQYQIVRIIIEDQNTGSIMKNTVKFSISESNCKEVCKLIEKTFSENLLPAISGARRICKTRSVKIDVSELDNSGTKLRKVNRTVNLQGVNAREAGERLIQAVNEVELMELIKRVEELSV